MMKKGGKKVMIFGVFDGLHDGHRFFINEAKKFGENLIIIVTRNNIVKVLKNYQPHFPAKKRISALKKEFPNSSICIGDEKINTWQIIKKQKPDLIILGYDQLDLKISLKKIQKVYNFKLLLIKNHYNGDIIHSSLLSKK